MTDEIDINEIKNRMINPEDYEIIKFIGSGKYGDVFKVKKGINYYALKKITKYDETAFNREVYILSLLDHPCVLDLRGFSIPKDDYPATIVTELLSCGTLKDAVLTRPDGWDATKQMINIYGIAAGMEHCHSKDVLHRDLKPENILLNSRFEPHITDFGLAKIAKLLHKSTSEEIPTSSEVSDEDTYNQKNDVYNYAIIVYFILTGSTPSENEENVDTDHPSSLEDFDVQLPDEIPEIYKSIIISCWKKDLDSRPTFTEIIQQLIQPENCLDDVDIDEYENYKDRIENEIRLIDELNVSDDEERRAKARKKHKDEGKEAEGQEYSDYDTGVSIEEEEEETDYRNESENKENSDQEERESDNEEIETKSDEEKIETKDEDEETEIETKEEEKLESKEEEEEEIETKEEEKLESKEEEEEEIETKEEEKLESKEEEEEEIETKDDKEDTEVETKEEEKLESKDKEEEEEIETKEDDKLESKEEDKESELNEEKIVNIVDVCERSVPNDEERENDEKQENKEEEETETEKEEEKLESKEEEEEIETEKEDDQLETKDEEDKESELNEEKIVNIVDVCERSVPSGEERENDEANEDSENEGNETGEAEEDKENLEQEDNRHDETEENENEENKDSLEQENEETENELEKETEENEESKDSLEQENDEAKENEEKENEKNDENEEYKDSLEQENKETKNTLEQEETENTSEKETEETQKPDEINESDQAKDTENESKESITAKNDEDSSHASTQPSLAHDASRTEVRVRSFLGIADQSPHSATQKSSFILLPHPDDASSQDQQILDDATLSSLVSSGDLTSLMRHLHDSCDFETTNRLFESYRINNPDDYESLISEGVSLGNAVSHHKRASLLLLEASKASDKKERSQKMEDAQNHLKKSIEKKYGPSSLLLSILYMEMLGLETEAFNALREGARNNDAYCRCLLGYFIAHGIGTEKDFMKGASMIVKSGAPLSFCEQFSTDIGLYYSILSESSDDERASLESATFQWFENAFKIRENAATINNYGLCFLRGFGVEKNVEMARQVFDKGVEKSDPNALYHSAFILEEEDRSKSLQFYKMAADKEHRAAQAYYAYLVSAENEEESQRYFELAAKGGHADSHSNLGRMLIEKDPDTAIYHLKKSAEKGNCEAASFLAVKYSRENDHENAFKYMDLLIRSGSYKVPLEYAVGLYRAKEFRQALSYFLRLKSFNHPIASFYVGVMKFYGQGCERNRDEAFSILKKLSESGVEKATDFIEDNFVV